MANLRKIFHSYKSKTPSDEITVLPVNVLFFELLLNIAYIQYIAGAACSFKVRILEGAIVGARQHAATAAAVKSSASRSNNLFLRIFKF